MGKPKPSGGLRLRGGLPTELGRHRHGATEHKCEGQHARVGPWPAPQPVCLLAPGIRAGRRRAVIILQSCPKPASATLQVENTLHNVWENRARDLREADPPPCSPHSIGRAARHAAASPLFGVDVVAPGGLRQRSVITVWIKITELMPRTNYLQHTL